jgi:hypothetical protein
MPNLPSGSKPDPMSREVDRLLAQLADVGSGRSRESDPYERTHASRPTFRSRVRPRPRAKADQERYDRIALWARVFLASVLGVVITQWPYAHACGWPLIGYLGAITMVLLAGGWIAVASWNQREAAAHALSFILVFWGTVLAAEQLLPRIGYAALSATWRCGAEPWLPFMGS